MSDLPVDPPGQPPADVVAPDRPAAARLRLASPVLASAMSAVDALELSGEVATALAGEAEPDGVARLVVSGARTLMAATFAALATVDEEDLVVRAVDGTGGPAIGTRTPRAPAPGDAAEAGGHALAVAIDVGGFPPGTLRVEVDPAGPPFTTEDGRLLRAYAGSVERAMDDRARPRRPATSHAEVVAERLRWARDIHDGPLQELAHVLLMLSVAAGDDDSGTLHEAMDEVALTTRQVIVALRTMIRQSRPATALDLEASVQLLAERLRHRSGVAVDVLVEAAVGLRDDRDDVTDAAYRVVQEALTNVVRHAGATAAVVELRHTHHQLLVVVSDDGAGFDPEVAREGFGLIGVRERVAALDGTLRIVSRPGGGTSIRVTLPSGRPPAP